MNIENERSASTGKLSWYFANVGCDEWLDSSLRGRSGLVKNGFCYDSVKTGYTDNAKSNLASNEYGVAEAATA